MPPCHLYGIEKFYDSDCLNRDENFANEGNQTAANLNDIIKFGKCEALQGSQNFLKDT